MTTAATKLIDLSTGYLVTVEAVEIVNGKRVLRVRDRNCHRYAKFEAEFAVSA
jgi:hypothetical protein